MSKKERKKTERLEELLKKEKHALIDNCELRLHAEEHKTGGLIQRCSIKRDPRVVGRHFSAFQEALSFIPVTFSEHPEQHGRPGTPTSFC